MQLSQSLSCEWLSCVHMLNFSWVFFRVEWNGASGVIACKILFVCALPKEDQMLFVVPEDCCDLKINYWQADLVQFCAVICPFDHDPLTGFPSYDKILHYVYYLCIISELYSSDTAAINCSTQRLLQIKETHFFWKLNEFSTGNCPVAHWEVMET